VWRMLGGGGRSAGKSGDGPRCGVGYAAWSVTVILQSDVAVLATRERACGLVIVGFANLVAVGMGVVSRGISCLPRSAVEVVRRWPRSWHACLMHVGDYIRTLTASYYRPLPHSLSILVGIRGNESHKAPECMDGSIAAAGGFAQPVAVCWLVDSGLSHSTFS
jgi:hypothetical protein